MRPVLDLRFGYKVPPEAAEVSLLTLLSKKEGLGSLLFEVVPECRSILQTKDVDEEALVEVWSKCRKHITPGTPLPLLVSLVPEGYAKYLSEEASAMLVGLAMWYANFVDRNAGPVSWRLGSRGDLPLKAAREGRVSFYNYPIIQGGMVKDEIPPFAVLSVLASREHDKQVPPPHRPNDEALYKQFKFMTSRGTPPPFPKRGC
ncbi:MAG TPA: hypothetical protein VM222_02325 [Planctomycetota bacterium]|nr:hypothetical protein [Planctomycetota bacterium]